MARVPGGFLESRVSGFLLVCCARGLMRMRPISTGRVNHKIAHHLSGTSIWAIAHCNKCWKISMISHVRLTWRPPPTMEKTSVVGSAYQRRPAATRKSMRFSGLFERHVALTLLLRSQADVTCQSQRMDIMPRFAANLAYLFTERPLLERFGAAAAAGFKAVELQAPYDHTPSALKAEIDKHGLTQLGINTFVGGRPGDSGLGAVPGRERDWDVVFKQALDYTVGDRRQRDPLHGRHGAAGAAAGGGADLHRQSVARGRPGQGQERHLADRADQPRATGRIIFSTAIEQAADIIAKVGRPNVKIQFDFYHVQIVSGDLITRFEKHLPLIGHVQIAAVPSRAEPDEGEINYPAVFAALDRLGWTGWTACEYKPRGAHRGWPGLGPGLWPRRPPGLTLSPGKKPGGTTGLYGLRRPAAAATLAAMWGQKAQGCRSDGARGGTAWRPEGSRPQNPHRDRREVERGRRSPRRRDWRGSNCSTMRSIRCSTKRRRTSICSTAASAGATRRGCGSTPSRMWRWRATSGATVSCRTRASAARCWRNPTTSPRSSRRSPIMSPPASSSASGRWPRTRVRCTRDCIGACMARPPPVALAHGPRVPVRADRGLCRFVRGASGSSRRGCRTSSRYANSGWRLISPKPPSRQPRETIVQRHAPQAPSIS